jgi:hypothetical protein
VAVQARRTVPETKKTKNKTKNKTTKKQKSS